MKAGIAIELQRNLYSVLFSVLFAIHTLLASFEIKPFLWMSQWMFRLGLNAESGAGAGRQENVREMKKQDTFPVAEDIKSPIVIRGFFHEVTVEELMQHAGPNTQIQTHAYENDQLRDETVTLQELVERIQQGLSTNAKSVVFEDSPDFPPFSGLKEKVDSLRGTVGMSWNELE